MAKKSPLTKAGRQARAITLKLRGLNDTEISTQLTNEGYPFSSPRTISRILKDIPPDLYKDELWNQQLRDITSADQPLRLKYRDRMLDKVMPRPAAEINIQQTQTQAQAEVKPHEYTLGEAMSEYGEPIIEAVLERVTKRGGEPPQPDNQQPLVPRPE